MTLPRVEDLGGRDGVVSDRFRLSFDGAGARRAVSAPKVGGAMDPHLSTDDVLGGGLCQFSPLKTTGVTKDGF